MKLITKALEKRLLANGILSAGGESMNNRLPVVKLFTPDGQCTWLLVDINPDNRDEAFGLCDLGFGCPELGYVSLSELSEARGPLGLPIERDMYATLDRTLGEYAEEAWAAGEIKA